MDNSVKKKAGKFLKDFRLQTVTLEALRAAIRQQGYTIVEFNAVFNDENVAALLEALGLEEHCRRARGFTYADSKRRLVFLHEDLSYEEKLMVLAHEEGHIYCNHFTTAPILGRDVVEEHEANEFAHYLLHRSFGRRAMQFLGRHKRLTVSVAAGVLLVFAAALILGLVQQERRYYGKYYITATGNKYHTKDCSFVSHKDNAERLTVEQFESGKYEPCDVCLP